MSAVVSVEFRSAALAFVLSVLAFLICGCSPGVSVPLITSQPADRGAYVLQAVSFHVYAKGDRLTYQWQKNGMRIYGATSSSYTTPPVTMADNGAKFKVIVTDITGGNVTSSPATLSVTPGSDATTYHYDNMRSGVNTDEKVLSKTSVNLNTFGQLGSFRVDGLVDGQPLYLSNVSIPSVGAKNVLYVVTEHGTAYAFDADGVSGNTAQPLWQTSTLMAGESSSDDRGCDAVTPEIGITATPVIDRNRGAIYVVAASKDAAGNYYERLHALDLTTGKELFGGPVTIAATYPGSGADSSNGYVVFQAAHYLERAALLEMNGTIYTTWASHCDLYDYTSWLIAYSADTLQQVGVFNLVPNGSDGGIWMSGAGPAADSNGNIFITVGNGQFDTALNAKGLPAQGDCGNCFVKISSTPTLALLDYFTPADTVSESATDHDFGSGGPLLLPDVKDAQGNTRHLAVSGAKDMNLYVVDRDNLGHFDPDHDSIYQEIVGAFGGYVYSKPVYFNGVVYFGASSDALKAFPIADAQLQTTPQSQTSYHFYYPGVTRTITANGTADAIVWAVGNSAPDRVAALLFAYDATNLATELYDSSQAPNFRDRFGNNKFITPLVINGNVYIGTPNSVVVFGLFP